jgi:hypothetical protein
MRGELGGWAVNHGEIPESICVRMEKEVSAHEIRKTRFSMECNKALRPNGFPTAFKKVLPIIGEDLVAIVRSFFI